MKKRMNPIFAMMLAFALLLTQPVMIGAEELRTENTGSEQETISSEELEQVIDESRTSEVVDLQEDFQTGAVGENGVAYDDVAYISAGAVSRLDEETRNEYYEICDQIATDKENGLDYEAVIAVDETGDLSTLYIFEPMDFASGLTGEAAVAMSTEASEESGKQAEKAEEPKEEASVTETPVEIVAENTETLAEKEIPEEYIEVDPISFDVISSDRDYFRDQLSSNGKLLFDALVTAAQNNSNTASVSGKLSSTEVMNAISAALNTYVKAFEWTNGAFNMITSGDTLKVTVQKSNYWSDSRETQAQNKVQEIADAARSYAKTNYPSDISYGIVNYVDNWLCANVAYDYDVAGGKNSTTDEYYQCHSSYGALLYGRAVCESYSKAASRVFDAAGIRNLYVTGNVAGGGHAWNYVCLGSNWYLLDITWDDARVNGKETDTSTKKYYLIGSGNKGSSEKNRMPKGNNFSSGTAFYFPSLSYADYKKGTSGPEPVPEPEPDPVKNEYPAITTSSLPSASEGKAYSVQLSGTGSTPLTWSKTSGSLPQGLSISSDGLISGTPAKSGNFTFTVQLKNDYGTAEKTYTLTVQGNNTVPVTGLVLNKEKLSMMADDSVKLTATVYPLNATDRTVKWESDNTGVATVDENGTVKAVAKGTATVTVTTNDKGFKKFCVVTVINNAGEPQKGSVDKVMTNKAAITLQHTSKITKWVSSDKTIATVKKKNNKSCTVTGKKAGIVTITGYKGTEPQVAFIVSVETPKLCDQILNIKTTLNVNNWLEGVDQYKPTKFTSSDKKVLKVDPLTGDVQVLKNGKAKITVYFDKGKIAKTYTVKMPKLAKSSLVVKKGKTKTLKINNYDASLGVYDCESSIDAVSATVNYDGTVTVYRSDKGKAVLTLTLNGVSYGTCKITTK
ncbi:MAG: Ig-like domain-containing protein [Lachnospiraceae bacterium]|nr:Ig-like domain-containing protein [Lachnospiraceae bacterium]